MATFTPIEADTPSQDQHRRGTLTENPTILERGMSLTRVDFAPDHDQPSFLRVGIATVLSIAGSLLADALLVVVGTALFPATKGYVHFRFHDYAKLTVIGVIIACVAWPVVTRVSSSPRWLFFRLAILVTLVLFAPDLWLLAKSQPPKAVGVLMAMHLAIALVTYNLLVHLAPARGVRKTPRRRSYDPSAIST
jgi:hypothetical protein